MTVLLRDVGPDDRDWLLDLNNAAVPKVSHLAQRDLGDLLSIACYARIASVDDQPLGVLIGLWPGTVYDSANYRWFSERHDDFLYVDRVIVADGAQGQGIGRAIYTDIEAFAGTRARRIALEVNSLPPNPVSRRFHEAAGFQVVGELAHDGGRKKVVMMIKTLARASAVSAVGDHDG